MDPAALAYRVLQRERSAIGRALSLVEDRRLSALPAILTLLRALRSQPASNQAFRVGLTGPPGAGKSSLVCDLARAWRRRGRAVGVLAVDPTSPRSGGALLGDRSRIDPDPNDDSIFVRSMASGGDLGGLARAARSAVDVLAASHDVVVIETVGVGQNETDVELVADATVLVMQPASGDILQFLKAGILEIPEVFVVNKMDLGDVAARTRRELLASLTASRSAGLSEREPVVIPTSTVTHEGIEPLIDALDEIRAGLEGSGELMRRRLAGECAWSYRLLVRKVGEMGIDALGGPGATRAELEAGLHRGSHGLELVAQRAEAALRTLRTSDRSG